MTWQVAAAVGAVLSVAWVVSVSRPRRPAYGDPELAALVDALCDRRVRRLAVVAVDTRAGWSQRALIRCGPDTHFELGSVTKALTGMLLADAIARDEVQLSTTVSEVLADLAGTDVADVTLQELCTHTSGLPRLPGGPIFLFKAWLALLFGLNPYVGQSTNRVARQAGRQRLRNRGRYLYSNLGGALLGQVVARRAGLDYSAALSRRILGPLGMSGAGVTTAEWKAPLGWSGLGLPRAAWTMGGYAPAGGVMATVADLEVLARGGRARTGLPPAH